MIHKITDEGMHAGHDDKGREFAFLINAENSKRAGYEQEIATFADTTEFGIGDEAFTDEGQLIPGYFAVYVLAAAHVDRTTFINRFIDIEDRLDKAAMAKVTKEIGA